MLFSTNRYAGCTLKDAKIFVRLSDGKFVGIEALLSYISLSNASFQNILLFIECASRLVGYQLALEANLVLKVKCVL